MSFCSSCEFNWFLISLYRTQSSANRRTVEWILLGKSLMYIRKRRGPSTVPCGTPDSTWVQGECPPLTTTLCSRHVRNFEIQACVLLLMPYLFNLFRCRLCGTVSNAFEKYIMIMSNCDLLFRDLDRSCVMSINWISVEFLLRKPCYLSDKIERWSRVHVCSERLHFADANSGTKHCAAV